MQIVSFQGIKNKIRMYVCYGGAIGNGDQPSASPSSIHVAKSLPTLIGMDISPIFLMDP